MIYQGLTFKQRLLAEYLLQQLGFGTDEFVAPYLDQFHTVSHFDSYHQDWVQTNNAIEVLEKEIDLRRKINTYYKFQRTDWISASEIENFTFCPVAFSIASTFKVPSNSLAEAGTELHKKETLNLKVKEMRSEYGVGPYFRADKETTTRSGLAWFFSSDNRDMINEIENADLLFSDAAGQNDQLFKSKKGKFVGRPDYIFRNRATGTFVVEEKYALESYYNSANPRRFYKNHIYQTRSYLYGIAEYEIDYAYLVYWRYYYQSEKPYISNAASVKIERSEQARNELVAVYRAMRKVLSTGSAPFYPVYRHPVKCANCAVAVFCGHKGGALASFQYPYAYEHILPKKVLYPEILKKSSRIEVIQVEGRTYNLHDRLFKEYCQALVASLNLDGKPLDYTKYNAEWEVYNGKLYLRQFTFFGKKGENGKREVVWEYSAGSEEDHLISFISMTTTGYYEKTRREGETETTFDEIRLDIRNGLVRQRRD